MAYIPTTEAFYIPVQPTCVTAATVRCYDIRLFLV
jgi:hypothetical protein